MVDQLTPPKDRVEGGGKLTGSLDENWFVASSPRGEPRPIRGAKSSWFDSLLTAVAFEKQFLPIATISTRKHVRFEARNLPMEKTHTQVGGDR